MQSSFITDSLSATKSPMVKGSDSITHSDSMIIPLLTCTLRCFLSSSTSLIHRLTFSLSFPSGTSNHKSRRDQAQYRMTVVVDGNYGQGRMAYQMGMKSGEGVSEECKSAGV